MEAAVDTDPQERDAMDTLKDAVGMDNPNDEPAMTSGDPETTDAQVAGDEDATAGEEPVAGGGEKTEVEGLAGLGATNRGFGGQPPQVQGGIGTNVHAADEEDDGSTDPRGY
jgi:hypothetical protein